MADNIILDPGSGGSTVKTDDDGTAHWQYVKMAYGADNTQTRVTASVGLPIDILSSTVDVMLGTDFSSVFGTSSVLGAGTEAGAVRVTVATDSTGVLSIDDGGGSITIDGTVTANLSATDNAVLDTIDAVLDTINAKLVSGTVIGDVNLGATDNAVLDSIASLLTTIDADTSNITACDTGAVVISSGTVTTVSTVTNLAQMGGVAISLNTGVRDTGTQRVTIATDDVVPASQSGTWTVDLGATDNAVLDTIDAVLDTINAKLVTGTVIGDVNVSAALPAGTNAIGKLAANAGVDIGDVTPIPKTSGGLSFYKTIDLDESEEEVKATAGQVYGFFFTNSNASVRYLKFYNATAATVVVGTTVPDMTYAIPPSNSGLFVKLEMGLAFSTAITIAATTGVADNDAGAPGANEVIGTVFYK